MPETRTLLLYSTLGCHLCDNAKALLRPLLAETGYRLKEIDIAGADRLLRRYGTRIPVLAREDNGRELGWPFGDGELRQFLDASPTAVRDV